MGCQLGQATTGDGSEAIEKRNAIPCFEKASRQHDRQPQTSLRCRPLTLFASKTYGITDGMVSRPLTLPHRRETARRATHHGQQRDAGGQRFWRIRCLSKPRTLGVVLALRWSLTRDLFPDGTERMAMPVLPRESRVNNVIRNHT